MDESEGPTHMTKDKMEFQFPWASTSQMLIPTMVTIFAIIHLPPVLLLILYFSSY